MVWNYIGELVETSRLSGCLFLTESMRCIIRRNSVIVCEKEEYVANVLVNQMMKATLEMIQKMNLILIEL